MRSRWFEPEHYISLNRTDGMKYYVVVDHVLFENLLIAPEGMKFVHYDFVACGSSFS
jgi:hypothetical protein